MTERPLVPDNCLPFIGGGILLNAFYQINNKGSCRVFLHPTTFVLSARQRSCEYHCLKSMKRNWTPVYRLWSGRYNHYISEWVLAIVIHSDYQPRLHTYVHLCLALYESCKIIANESYTVHRIAWVHTRSEASCSVGARVLQSSIKNCQKLSQ